MRRLGGARLALVDGDTAVQLAQLADGSCEPALGLRGAVERVVEPALLVCHVAVDLLGVVAAPVDVEDRSGHLPLLRLPRSRPYSPPHCSASRMLLSEPAAKSGDARRTPRIAATHRGASRRRAAQRAD